MTHGLTCPDPAAPRLAPALARTRGTTASWHHCFYPNLYPDTISGSTISFYKVANQPMDPRWHRSSAVGGAVFCRTVRGGPNIRVPDAAVLRRILGGGVPDPAPPGAGQVPPAGDRQRGDLLGRGKPTALGAPPGGGDGGDPPGAVGGGPA